MNIINLGAFIAYLVYGVIGDVRFGIVLGVLWGIVWYLKLYKRVEWFNPVGNPSCWTKIEIELEDLD